jgi:thiol-disulfide isomerase/thioredoxin
MMKRALLACLCAGSLTAAAGEFGVGTTRAEVIEQLGAPKSRMNSGPREILAYPKGRITLIDGKIESIDWKGTPPGSPSSAAMLSTPAAPAMKMVAAPAAAKPLASAPRADEWLTDFSAAQKLASEHKRRLLVLFTGSDWCPPCMQFEANVAHAPEFLGLANTAFVLVKLDFPRNTPQDAAVRERNEELRHRYGVNAYPSLLVISADGTKSAHVDTRRGREASGIVDYYVQAIDEARRAKEKSPLWPW